MIRAIVKNGLLHPLDPLPEDWSEGREVIFEAVDSDSTDSPEEIDKWYQELEAAAAELNDPEEWARIDAALAEADKQAKEYVRRQMGLSQ